MLRPVLARLRIGCCRLRNVQPGCARISALALCVAAVSACANVPEYSDVDPMLRARFEAAKGVCMRFVRDECAFQMTLAHCIDDRFAKCMWVQGYARQRTRWVLTSDMRTRIELNRALRLGSSPAR